MEAEGEDVMWSLDGLRKLDYLQTVTVTVGFLKLVNWKST